MKMDKNLKLYKKIYKIQYFSKINSNFKIRSNKITWSIILICIEDQGIIIHHSDKVKENNTIPIILGVEEEEAIIIGDTEVVP